MGRKFFLTLAALAAAAAAPAAAEDLLGGHGFIRIHRSALVNRSRIVRHLKGKVADEVQLADGTRLKVGGAYRPGLGSAAERRSA